MTMRTKKLQNRAEDVVPEMIEGMIAAHPHLLALGGETGRSVISVRGRRAGKVAIVIGGGSGHEPAFAGYVGPGLADAAVLGNVFASPSPTPILEAARAVDAGAGILLLYGNYSGDVMNFGIASDELAATSVPVRTVLVTDDVASAPAERAHERRGIAGDFFVFKIAGAAADRMLPLDEVVAAAEKANKACFTMGVALGACSLPQTRRPNFVLGEDEMEIGMGIHGEAGIRRGPLESADAIVDSLLEAILGEAALIAGDRVAVLVNGLGATAQMELYVLFRRVKQILDARGVVIQASFVGEYVTSLEMAGASVTLLKLDDDLAGLLDHPCETAALRVGARIADESASEVAPTAPQAAGAPARAREVLRADAPTGEIGAAEFRTMVRVVREAMDRESDRLCELDRVVGDGDHGVAMATGWATAERAIADAAMGEATLHDLCCTVSDAFLSAVGASSGPLTASAFTAAAEVAKSRRGLDAEATARFVEALSKGAASRGGAVPGDRTMIDALHPAAEAALEAAGAGRSAQEVLRAAADAAEAGREATARMVARKGRSAKLGERALGHVDPGAASAALMLAAMASFRVGP